MAKEAIELYIETLVDLGKEIPTRRVFWIHCCSWSTCLSCHQSPRSNWQKSSKRMGLF
jgi:predicted RNase H-like HicB family nuclease